MDCIGAQKITIPLTSVEIDLRKAEKLFRFCTCYGKYFSGFEHIPTGLPGTDTLPR